MGFKLNRYENNTIFFVPRKNKLKCDFPKNYIIGNCRLSFSLCAVVIRQSLNIFVWEIGPKTSPTEDSGGRLKQLSL